MAKRNHNGAQQGKQKRRRTTGRPRKTESKNLNSTKKSRRGEKVEYVEGPFLEAATVPRAGSMKGGKVIYDEVASKEVQDLCNLPLLFPKKNKHSAITQETIVEICGRLGVPVPKEDKAVKDVQAICKSIRENPEVVRALLNFKESKGRGPYTLKCFKKLWDLTKKVFGISIRDMENSSDFRRANQYVASSDSTNQGKAQYGCVLPYALDIIFDLLGLPSQVQVGPKPDLIFTDYGMGNANVVAQASYTRGVDAMGVELVEPRFKAALVIEQMLGAMAIILKALMPTEWFYKAGQVELKHGRIEDLDAKLWLSKRTRAFFNNCESQMGGRSEPMKGHRTVESELALLFAQSEPGYILVTMAPLPDLGATKSHILSQRRKFNSRNPKFVESKETKASFFEMEVHKIGEMCDCVSWSGPSNRKPVMAYKYVRLDQENEGSPVLLCANPKCSHSHEPFAAVVDEMLVTSCPKCGYRFCPRRK